MFLPTAGSHVWGPPTAGLCADLRTMQGLALRGCPLPLPSPFLHSSLAQTRGGAPCPSPKALPCERQPSCSFPVHMGHH